MTLFPDMVQPNKKSYYNFLDNNKLPIHRWFKYSAGFSANWVEFIIEKNQSFEVIADPFCGSGTTLIQASLMGKSSFGYESHPFVGKVARTKSNWYLASIGLLKDRIEFFLEALEVSSPSNRVMNNELMQRIYDEENLTYVAKTASALKYLNESVEDELIWLAVVSSLRNTSGVGTASWQYILPNKSKAKFADFRFYLRTRCEAIVDDVVKSRQKFKSIGVSRVIEGDFRLVDGKPSNSADAIITSPPYANNFDYADATRVEMTFLGDVDSWGDLHESVRLHIIRSCSQHASRHKKDIELILESNELAPIRQELHEKYEELSEIKGTKGGKKDYDLMIGMYFYDMALCIRNFRRILRDGGRSYIMIGDSAPYGIHIPVERWIASLALASGFHNSRFVKLRDRNDKWENRKHRVPLKEGILILRG